MSINWSEFSGQLPRLAWVARFCFVRKSRGAVPIVEPGEGKPWGGPSSTCVKVFKRVKPSSSQWCMVGGQEIAGVDWSHRGLCLWGIFHPEVCQVVGLGSPERLCRFLLWKFSKSSWTKPWESRCDFTANPALSLRFNQSPPDVLFHLNYPMALSSFCQQSSCSGRLWASLFRAACGLAVQVYASDLEQYSKHSSQS